MDPPPPQTIEVSDVSSSAHYLRLVCHIGKGTTFPARWLGNGGH